MAAAAFLIDCGIIRDLIATGVSRTLTLGIARVFELVLLITAVALCVMRFGLASATTVLALLDRTTLRVDVMQLAICGKAMSVACLNDNCGGCRGDVPVWLHPLTRWPLIQDAQANFSPSTRGMFVYVGGRLAVVAPGAGGRSEQWGKMGKAEAEERWTAAQTAAAAGRRYKEVEASQARSV